MIGSRLVLRRLGPLAPWIAAAQAAVVARDHWTLLSPAERQRLLALLKLGRPRNYHEADRRELRRLVRKLRLGALGVHMATGRRPADS